MKISFFLCILSFLLSAKADFQVPNFKHMINEKKCSLCHWNQNKEDFVLLDGTHITRPDTPKLCGQCHGPIYHDWLGGIHGKLYGKGTPHPEKFICIQCHNPHDPKFKQMKAEPPPHKPKYLIEKKEEHHGE